MQVQGVMLVVMRGRKRDQGWKEGGWIVNALSRAMNRQKMTNDCMHTAFDIKRVALAAHWAVCLL